jgi:hypothetical protein
MRRFDLLVRKHDVDLRTKRLCWDVVLTTFPDWIGGRGPTISICDRLDKPSAILGVAIMFGCLELDWPGSDHRIRFPLPDGPHIDRELLHRARRDYRVALRWARTFLVPDHAIVAWRAEGRTDVHELAWALDVPYEIAEARVKEYRARKTKVSPFFAL